MKHALLTFCLALFPASAWAYYGVLDNAEIVPANQYKFTGDLQALTDQGGLNAAIRADMGYKDEFGGRLLLGTGSTDIFVGGLVKWIPIPDIKGQPAIGFNAGLLYARANGNRDTTIRFEPLVAKKFVVDELQWTPYASLPVGFRSRDNKDVDNHSDVTWQFVAGTQLQIQNFKNLQFIGEFGVDIDHALSHVSLGAIYYLDPQKGLVLE